MKTLYHVWREKNGNYTEYFGKIRSSTGIKAVVKTAEKVKKEAKGNFAAFATDGPGKTEYLTL